MGFCARVGGTVDVGIQPAAAHSTLHYIRVYFRVGRGAAESDRCLEQVKHVSSCGSCHENSVTEDYTRLCPRCGGKARCTGPQWVGGLLDDKVVAKSAEDCAKLGWRGAAETLSALEGVDGFPPFGYSMEAITSREKVSSVRFQKVVDLLRAAGRAAMSQPFGSSGLKTDASYREVIEAVRRSGA